MYRTKPNNNFIRIIYQNSVKQNDKIEWLIDDQEDFIFYIYNKNVDFETDIYLKNAFQKWQILQHVETILLLERE